MSLAYRDEDSLEVKQQLAAWRREGKASGWCIFHVEGFDEEFVMRLPGRLSETFSKVLATQELAKSLNVRPKHVIFKSIEKDRS